MASSLPEDVLLEILFRIKDVPAALFRCATACKRWRCLVAEATFLRRCWPGHDASSTLVGLFTVDWVHGACFAVLTPCFTPTPRSALGPGRRTLSYFLTAAPKGVFNNAAPLVSRRGLLLVRLNTMATRGYQDPTILDLAVCNMLIGTCHMLPALKFGSVFDACEWNGYAILTGADCCSDDETILPSTSPFFKVVILSSYNNDGMKSTLHTFSSDEESWSVRTNCFDGMVRPCQYWSSSRAVVCRGMAHWLLYRHADRYITILNLNTGTGNTSLTKLPFRLNSDLYNVPFLTLAVNGALSLLCMQRTATQLEIWEQQEGQPNKNNVSEWVWTRKIKLKQLSERANEVSWLYFLGDKCGSLLVNDTNTDIYLIDLETGMMEEVVDWHRQGYIVGRETVPLEVDWPAIFASRLVRKYS